MMRPVLVLMLAMICGIASAWGFLSMNRGQRPAREVKQEETVEIVVAVADLSKWHVIAPEDIALRPWPKSVVPEDALTDLEEAQGRVVDIPMLPNDPLVKQKLAEAGVGVGLPALIPIGMRAFTIQTSTASSRVAGFLRPENIVDVLLNQRGSRTDGGSTEVLLEAVRILAVDQVLDEASGSVSPDLKSVTLLVTPEQARMLSLGQETGSLSLALRNPTDIATPTIGTNDLSPTRGDAGLVEAAETNLWTGLTGWLATVAQSMPESQPAAAEPRKPRPPELWTLRGATWNSVVISNRR